MELGISGELAKKANPIKKEPTVQNLRSNENPKIQKKDSVDESKNAVRAADVKINSPEKVDIKI
tara:strand:+ start:293 stop:484 length:192 start_codon:yes stop_codon:yes gene_type:complete